MKSSNAPHAGFCFERNFRAWSVCSRSTDRPTSRLLPERHAARATPTISVRNRITERMRGPEYVSSRGMSPRAAYSTSAAPRGSSSTRRGRRDHDVGLHRAFTRPSRRSPARIQAPSSGWIPACVDGGRSFGRRPTVWTALALADAAASQLFLHAPVTPRSVPCGRTRGRTDDLSVEPLFGPLPAVQAADRLGFAQAGALGGPRRANSTRQSRHSDQPPRHRHRRRTTSLRASGAPQRCGGISAQSDLGG